MTREPRRVPRPSRDPYGLLPTGLPIAPLLSVAGLVLVAALTFNLANGRLPFIPGGGGGGPGSPPPVARTPTPSDVVVVPEDPRASVPGSIVYVKHGNVWIQSGNIARQITDGGRDSMPSFSEDGAWIYFVRTRAERGLWPVQGRNRWYDLDIPSVMRVRLAGGLPEPVLDGRVRRNTQTWAAWVREPVLGPDGTTLALVTDLPDPTRSNVVLKLYDLATQELTATGVPETVPLGHQSPAWRHDGAVLLYVRNNRDGARGTPVIMAYTVETGRVRTVTNPGYLHPAWSPDGRFIAATRTSAFGTDVVILDAANGAELLRLTTDGSSWAPTWSPRGDAIAFLHTSGPIVDLRMIELEGSGPTWTALEPLDLTILSGLDSVSRPDWHIPADQLPPTPPPPTPTPAASPAGSPVAP